MQYITTNRYKGNGIGGHFNLSYSTLIEEKDGVLYHDNRPICVARSLNGKKHFAINEDGQGLKRGELTYFIAYSNRQKEHSDGHIFRFSEEEIEMLIKDYPQWIRQTTPILFSDDFFTAKVEDLQELADRLGGIKCTK
jgi:hypothetical protein